MAVEHVDDYRGLGDARIELGTGVLVKVEREQGKRNALVEVRAPNLQHPLKGWADTSDPSLRLDVPPGSAVDYRIVVRRRRTEDRGTPLDQLPNSSKLRDLVYLAPALGGAPPPPPVTDPDAGPQRAPDPIADPRVQPSRAVASDARPWEPTNTDGRINLGSYEVLAAAGTIDLAATLLRTHAPARVREPAAVVQLAGALLAMADTIQTAATGGRVDRMSSSHTRARGFLRTAVEVIPPCFDGTREERIEWREQVTRYAVALFRGACDLVEEHR